MTGPEHYREAERLLRHAETPHADAALTLADAQVHATLALAAATAAAGIDRMTALAAISWDSAARVTL